MDASPATLALLRHGESEWNHGNLFAGWADIDLTPRGLAQAAYAGTLLRGAEPSVVHTSLLKRSIHTAEEVLDQLDRPWVPVRRSWRLNERQYGALVGRDKASVRAEYGHERFTAWRRSYDGTPPPLPEGDWLALTRDPRYAELAGDVPRAESLRDVTARLLPYWYDVLLPDLRDHGTVLVVAHSNSLRALVKHLDGLDDERFVGLNIPTGVPLVYRIDRTSGTPAQPGTYLDAEAAERGIAEVAAQGDAARRDEHQAETTRRDAAAVPGTGPARIIAVH
ncbi:MAG: 2,3-bisphosphoglycerate-dependent phosphoglycerate mutase [Actinocrinis sp.]